MQFVIYMIMDEGHRGYIPSMIVVHSCDSQNSIPDATTPFGEWLGLEGEEGRGKLR